MFGLILVALFMGIANFLLILALIGENKRLHSIICSNEDKVYKRLLRCSLDNAETQDALCNLVTNMRGALGDGE